MTITPFNYRKKFQNIKKIEKPKRILQGCKCPLSFADRYVGLFHHPLSFTLFPSLCRTPTTPLVDRAQFHSWISFLSQISPRTCSGPFSAWGSTSSYGAIEAKCEAKSKAKSGTFSQSVTSKSVSADFTISFSTVRVKNSLKLCNSTQLAIIQVEEASSISFLKFRWSFVDNVLAEVD